MKNSYISLITQNVLFTQKIVAVVRNGQNEFRFSWCLFSSVRDDGNTCDRRRSHDVTVEHMLGMTQLVTSSPFYT